MDIWSIETPTQEYGEFDYSHVRSGSSQADETESVGSKWHGPGFGLLPSGKEAVELPHGKIERGKQGLVRCVAG